MANRQQVEAILFASGKSLTPEYIGALVGAKESEVIDFLRDLRKDYDNLDSALKVVEGNDGWKLTIKERYTPFVRNVVAETELTKTVMETLGVIAWKYPALQCDIIKIRTNKAYDHLDQLEEVGFITREKYGRTKRIRLTEKFFSYFELPKHKQAFKNIIPEEIREKVRKVEEEIDDHEKVIEDDKIHKELEKQKQKQIETFGGINDVSDDSKDSDSIEDESAHQIDETSSETQSSEENNDVETQNEEKK